MKNDLAHQDNEKIDPYKLKHISFAILDFLSTFQSVVQPVEGKKLLRRPPLLPSYFSSRQFLVPTGDRESQTITRRAELVLFQNWDNGLTFARSREKRESRGKTKGAGCGATERFGAAHG